MSPFVNDPDFVLHVGDALEVLAAMPDESVHCVVTSPPYWGLRDYGTEGQLGLEPTPEEYVASMVAVFREVRRVLRRDGTCWLNIGDSYASGGGLGAQGENGQMAGRGVVNARRLGRNDAGRNFTGGGGNREGSGNPGQQGVVSVASGLKPKDLVGIPWRLAFALQTDGWYLRSDIIWSKPNPMPESVTDRPTKAHEYLFLLTRSPRYFYDADAIREPAELRDYASWDERKANGEPRRRGFDVAMRPGNVAGLAPSPTGRNKRSVWEIATEPYPDAHFATFPQALVEPCVLAGTSERGCCPECGAPWERETDGASYYTGDDGVRTRKTNKVGNGHGGSGRGPKDNLGSYIAQTTGWRPTCDCRTYFDLHERLIVPKRVPRTALDPLLIVRPVPCTVLDPFMGSGTVAVVTRRLGRRAVGIELNPEYAVLASKRLAQLSLLAA